MFIINYKKAFTLVELIIVITILTIIASIAFISFLDYQKNSRDSKRASEVSASKKALEIFALKAGNYPLPDNYNTVSFSGETAWFQGTIGDNVFQILSSNLSDKPIDPILNSEFVYSVTNSKKQFEVLSIYESDLISYNPLIQPASASSDYTTKIEGNYNGVFVKTDSYYIPTPSIINAEVENTELNIDNNNIKSQAFQNGDNRPAIGALESITGALDISLDPYEGNITIDSSMQEKIDLALNLKNAYSGSIISNNGIYKDIVSKESGNELENLVDSIVLNSGSNSDSPIASLKPTLADLYDSGDESGLIDGSIYTKKFDDLSRVIYQKSDNTFWSRNGDLIPNSMINSGIPNLPNNIDASSIVFSGGCIVISSPLDASSWNDAPNGIKMCLDGVEFTHMVSSGVDFWTDNSSGDGQASASIIFTRFGRSMLPNITNSSIKAYTIQLCSNNPSCTKDDISEPRYTDSGVDASDSNYSGFKEWFYASSGNIVNNLVDGIIIQGHACNPITLRRFSDNKIYGWYKGAFIARNTDKSWVDVKPNNPTLNEVYFTNWSNNRFQNREGLNRFYIHEGKYYTHCLSCAVSGLRHISVGGRQPELGWGDDIINCPINSSGTRVNIGNCKM